VPVIKQYIYLVTNKKVAFSRLTLWKMDQVLCWCWIWFM